jgi:protein-disulfide isomerase
MKHLVIIAFLAVALAAATAGCRQPATNNPWAPDAGGFDAGEDDAGLFNNAHSPYIGGDQAVELEVVDFSFFRCHVCATFSTIVRDMWGNDQDVRDRVRLFFHHFPFTGQTNWRVHAATVAAANQGFDHFWAMHDHIYDGMNELGINYDPDELREFADQVLGLDMAQYDIDVDHEVTWGFLEWDRAQLEAQGYTSTPSVFICGEKVYWEDVEGVVDSYLNPE